MPATKRDVEVLNNEATALARLGVGGGKGVGDILDALITAVNRVSNQVVGLSAGVAIATTASKVKTAVAVQFLVNGVYTKLAISDNFWTLTGANLADGYTRKYLLLVDGAGAASVLASDDRLTAAAAQCVFPAIPAGKVCLGVLQVDTSGAAFVPGTTLLSAGTVTDTYTDGHPAGVLGAPTVTPLV